MRSSAQPERGVRHIIVQPPQGGESVIAEPGGAAMRRMLPQGSERHSTDRPVTDFGSDPGRNVAWNPRSRPAEPEGRGRNTDWEPE